MLRLTELKENVTALPVVHGATMANDSSNLTKAFANVLATSQFEEACLLIYLASFSATPATPTVKVEVLESEEAAGTTASAYAVAAEAQEQTFGAVADGGGGETLAGGVLKFFFKPGQFKKWTRFRITLDTTAGTETATYSAILLLGAARNVPISEPVVGTVLVTPS